MLKTILMRIRQKKIPQEDWLCRKYNKLIVSLESPHAECICFFLNMISSILDNFQCLLLFYSKTKLNFVTGPEYKASCSSSETFSLFKWMHIFWKTVKISIKLTCTYLTFQYDLFDNVILINCLQIFNNWFHYVWLRGTGIT